LGGNTYWGMGKYDKKGYRMADIVGNDGKAGILILKNYGATTGSRPYGVLEIFENCNKCQEYRGRSLCPHLYNLFLKKTG